MTATRCGSFPGGGEACAHPGAEGAVRSRRDGREGLAGSACLGHTGLGIPPGMRKSSPSRGLSVLGGQGTMALSPPPPNRDETGLRGRDPWGLGPEALPALPSSRTQPWGSRLPAREAAAAPGRPRSVCLEVLPPLPRHGSSAETGGCSQTQRCASPMMGHPPGNGPAVSVEPRSPGTCPLT